MPPLVLNFSIAIFYPFPRLHNKTTTECLVFMSNAIAMETDTALNTLDNYFAQRDLRGYK